MYKIRTDEIKDPIDSFRSLNDFFIRKLTKNSRPLDTGETVLVSPVDAVLERSQTIDENARFTVKGQLLSLAELLGDAELAAKYTNGQLFVLYLSPADYHRIHAPSSTKLLHRYALGKKSWPVNQDGLRYGQRPICTNYRIINVLDNGCSAIFVGATNVNSIVCSKATDWKKGEEIAYFQFGSTVVLIFEEGRIKALVSEGARLKMGEALAEFLPKHRES